LSQRARDAGAGLNRKAGAFEAIAARICRSGDTSSRIQKPLPYVDATRSFSCTVRSLTTVAGRLS
jgi:hypothetical protein